MLSNPVVHHPAVLDIGPLQLTGFGIAVLFAFMIAEVVSRHELARRGHAVEAAAVPDVLFAALLGTLVGGKLYFILVISHRVADLWSRSGFVFWGGFIGSVLLCWLTIRHKKLSFGRFADVAGIAIAAGYSIGRTGCSGAQHASASCGLLETRWFRAAAHAPKIDAVSAAAPR